MTSNHIGNIPLWKSLAGYRFGLGYRVMTDLGESGNLGSVGSYGWGGISLLWHPAAFGGGWLSHAVGDVFWRLMDSRNERQETWLSAIEFVRSVRQRYIEVGLLSEEYGSAEPEEPVQQPSKGEFVAA